MIGDARERMLPALGDKGFSVAFLDMDVYAVMREILLQLWGIARGRETIIVHDIDSPGVRKAVDEFHLPSGRIAKEINLGEGTVSLEIPPL